MSMSSATGLHVLHDTGPPEGSGDHTTVVLVHGYGSHGAIFKPLLPLAHRNNARIVVVNRRDYPGTLPYPARERELLVDPPLGASPEDLALVKDRLKVFMRSRGRELFDLLVELVKVSKGGLPLADRGKGGIILVGWSFGTTWMNALLANIASFHTDAEVNLERYVRRVVLYEPLTCLTGHPLPQNPYNPFTDPSLEPAGNEQLFMDWLSGYYTHRDLSSPSGEGLERCAYLTDPPPTLRTIPPETMGEVACMAPGVPGGSDRAVLFLAGRTGAFAELRQDALRLSTSESGEEHGAGPDSLTAPTGTEWADVEVRILWGDMSVWEMPYAVSCFRAELEERRKSGARMRNVTFARVRGANHFAHWDYPESTLSAMLMNESSVEGVEVRLAAGATARGT